jgi:hypothetical protein
MTKKVRVVGQPRLRLGAEEAASGAVIKDNSMDERKTVKVEVFSDDLPSSLIDAIKFLQELLEGIPEGLRRDATFEVEEDRSYPDIVIGYWRPETDEEMAKRLKQDEAYRANWERQERQQLAALKAKYEGN